MTALSPRLRFPRISLDCGNIQRAAWLPFPGVLCITSLSEIVERFEGVRGIGWSGKRWKREGLVSGVDLMHTAPVVLSVAGATGDQSDAA